MGTSFTFSMVGSETGISSKNAKRKQKKQNHDLPAIEEEELSVQMLEE